MLDQNTDRMWYVIGAVLLGGLLIAGAVGLYTNIMDGVDSSFQSTIDQAESIEVNPTDIPKVKELTGNILTDESVSHYFREGDNDARLTGSSGDYFMKSGERSSSGIRLDKNLFKDGSRYRLSFTIIKDTGDINGLSGHYHAAQIKGYYRNEKRIDINNTTPLDKGVRYNYVIDFVYDKTLNTSSTNDYLYIQPNRAVRYGLAYTANINHLKVVEIEVVE